MRPIERIAVFAGITLAIIIALSGRDGQNAAIARTPSYAAGIKVGTVDVYAIAEKMMAAPDLKKLREDTSNSYEAKANAINKALKELDDQLKVMPQNDPKVQDLLKDANAKQAEIQKLVQDRQVELERVNSQQLIDAYVKLRVAVETVATKMEYTHILANREYSRQITTVNLSQTLQELLARPIVKGIQADDITKAVMAELKLEP
jgi:Skp family chaperone for outer membrane proteins